jgi:hypothetical protein
MTLNTFAEIVPLIAVPVWFIVDRLEQIRVELKRFNDREEGRRTARNA